MMAIFEFGPDLLDGELIPSLVKEGKGTEDMIDVAGGVLDE